MPGRGDIPVDFESTGPIAMASSTPTAIAPLAILLATSACHRNVDDEPQVELIEHRVEPCRAYCDATYDPECGADPPPPRTADECFELCASFGRESFQWAYQEDGTDACAEEWLANLACLEALDCEGRYAAFNGVSLAGQGVPCEEESRAKADCFYSTPSLEREDPPQ